jgi:hypothetical protein
MDLNIFDAIGGQTRVQGVNFGSTNFKRDIPMYAELYLQGRMNLDDLVSKRIALREVNDGYAALKDGSLNRVVVTSFLTPRNIRRDARHENSHKRRHDQSDHHPLHRRIIR